ncbi:MAG TPA: RNA polymerase sigma factor [Acidimicrobiales bacterium]
MAVRAEQLPQNGSVDLDRDRALVLRHQAGDQYAFDELYRRYFPRLHLYCRRRVGDSHVAEELAQEAFLRALRAMPEFAGDRRFYPWMTVIAQRLCIDHQRRAARVEPAADIECGSIEDEHEHLYAAVDHDYLHQAMDRLAPRHREVLELREQRGWSYNHIAAHLEVPITTVEALLHRARKALRREFMDVSSGGRLAGVPIIGWLVARLARLPRPSTRVQPSTGATLAPLVGPAAACLMAVGVVIAPAIVGGSSSASPTTITTATASSAVSSGAAVTVIPAPSATAPTSTSTSSNGSRVPASPRSDAVPPPPAANAGVAQVYAGENGTTWAQQQAAAQPVQLDAGPLVQAGVDPAQIVSDVTATVLGGSP